MDDSRLPVIEGRDSVLVEIISSLLVATAASRATLRGPLAGTDTTIALLAESLADGVESMADGPISGIVEAGTYAYLREHHDLLIQPDCAVGPQPPETLTGYFGVRAQMLGPLVDGGKVIGTISVHQQGRTRDWTESEVRALREAVARVREHWSLR
ncbi:MAG: GAF domain-containing protein [Lacisediminihabitans sp.]